MIDKELQKFLPTNCPSCDSNLTYDGIHLMCNNDDCVGRIARKLGSAGAMLDLKQIGGKTLEPFAKDFKNMFELFRWARTEAKCISGCIDQYGIKYGSRSHEIFLNAFKNIKSLSYSQVILMLCYDGVGSKLAEQVAKEYCGIEPDYKGHEKALVDLFKKNDIRSYILNIVSVVESLGVIVDKPKVIVNNSLIHVCMTGSPKNFGFKTKEDFILKYPNVVEVSISDKNCQYLITDNLNSTSGKMEAAEKKGIKIVTYENFKIN